MRLSSRSNLYKAFPFRYFCASFIAYNVHNASFPHINVHIEKQSLKQIRLCFNGIRQRHRLPGRFQPSTFSAWRLNFCVRDGNRWNPPAIVTGNLFRARVRFALALRSPLPLSLRFPSRRYSVPLLLRFALSLLVRSRTLKTTQENILDPAIRFAIRFSRASLPQPPLPGLPFRLLRFSSALLRFASALLQSPPLLSSSSFLRSSPRPISISKLPHCCAFTADLSTLSSSRGLTSLRYGSLILEVGFTLRCLQRLSAPYFASLLCRWHDNSCTSGTSIPVLSY